MGVFVGPETNELGLVACFDPGNNKNLPATTSILPANEHGYAEWYCFVSYASATYSIVSAGVYIVEKETSTVMVSTSTGPTRGTFAVTAGRTYYSVGGPMNLVVEDQQHAVVPLTMAGTQFWAYIARAPYETTTYYVYSPYRTATVRFFNAPASGGITATPTSTATVAAGSQTTFTVTPTANVSIFISSSEPIIAAVTGNPNDKTILSPVSKYVYNRFVPYYSTIAATTPATVNNYCISDPTYPLMSQNIADGNGGDTAQGLGLEFLCDSYSWGNVLSDYTIVFPYTATVITSYWNGSAWVVWDTHSNITGDITNPPRVTRDGTNGPGVEAVSISGSSTNMASGATLWKWEGTAPFYLCINDSADDEFSVLGWMNTRQTTRNNRVYLNSTIGSGKLAVNGSLLYNTSGYYTFPTDQLTSYLMDGAFSMPTDDHTISIWFRSSFPNAAQTPVGYYTSDGVNELLFYFPNSTTFEPHTRGLSTQITISNISGQWTNVTRTRVKTTGYEEFYVNGSLISSRIMLANTAITTGASLIVGQEADTNPLTTYGGFATDQNLDGDFGLMHIYSRVLTSTEIQMLFNSTRGRFGV